MNEPIQMDIQKIPFLTAYGKKPRVQLECNDPSRTKQSFQKECDINTIMAKYQKTGLVSHVSNFKGNYSELPNQLSYHEALNNVMASKNAFSTLPSSIRTQFGNDPAQFLEFVQNPDNTDEMIEMGLAKAPGPLGANQNQEEVTADPAIGGPADNPTPEPVVEPAPAQ